MAKSSREKSTVKSSQVRRSDRIQRIQQAKQLQKRNNARRSLRLQLLNNTVHAENLIRRCPTLIPRIVEILSDVHQIQFDRTQSDELKILFLAGIGLYRIQDSRNIENLCRNLQEATEFYRASISITRPLAEKNCEESKSIVEYQHSASSGTNEFSNKITSCEDEMIADSRNIENLCRKLPEENDICRASIPIVKETRPLPDKNCEQSHLQSLVENQNTVSSRTNEHLSKKTSCEDMDWENFDTYMQNEIAKAQLEQINMSQLVPEHEIQKAMKTLEELEVTWTYCK